MNWPSRSFRLLVYLCLHKQSVFFCVCVCVRRRVGCEAQVQSCARVLVPQCIYIVYIYIRILCTRIYYIYVYICSIYVYKDMRRYTSTYLYTYVCIHTHVVLSFVMSMVHGYAHHSMNDVWEWERHEHHVWKCLNFTRRAQQLGLIHELEISWSCVLQKRSMCGSERDTNAVSKDDSTASDEPND